MITLPTVLAGPTGDAADALANFRRLAAWVADHDTQGCATAMAQTAVRDAERVYRYLAGQPLPLSREETAIRIEQTLDAWLREVSHD